jgi:hypothetical protein
MELKMQFMLHTIKRCGQEEKNWKDKINQVKKGSLP